MKIELHIHTEGFSYCGKLSVAEIVELYSKAGYDAIVLTNHFTLDLRGDGASNITKFSSRTP